MLLGQRFEEALTYATRLHSAQVRKGTDIPYIAHLMSVAALVLEDGGDEDQAIAALLHDAVEDQGGVSTLDEIRRRFGDRVASIVEGCTDAEVVPKPPWRARKEHYIEHLRHAPPYVLRVSLADKVHNARAILGDYRTHGEALWSRFNGGRTGALWYYRTLLDTYRAVSAGFLVDEFDRVVSELERLFGGERTDRVEFAPVCAEPYLCPMPSPIEALTQALEGRYRIERELGVGGMATVYLADDLKHDRKVAVKVLKPELAAVLGAERFVVEIKTTASLQHPHILPLFDSGTAAGFLFYVMPFIDGETLRTRLNRETQLGIDEAVRIAREVADALDYAHRHGVIHRDIKPENILLHDGRPMVADFGIALAVSAAAGGRMTETGLSLGTPHYMSPEQATAEKEITARSDIYSIGSVLYEMLAGNPPHTGASAQQIIMKIITEQPQSVTALRRSVPPNVAAAIAKSLEKLPADRFETAKAFSDALGNNAFTTTTVSSFAGATRHASWRKTLAAGLLFGALVGALGMVALHRADVRVGERSRAQVTFNGEARTPAISPDGDFVAYVELVCQRGQFAQCKSSLLVQEVGGTQPRALVRDALNLTTPKWTHDGQTLVVAGALDAGRGGLFAISRVSGTAQPIADGALGAYDTHPTGDTVLVMRPNRDSGRALVIALQSGAIVDSVKTPFVNPRDISWSPDGRFIAATEHDALWIADRHGRLLDSVTYSGARGPIRWSVDGRSLLGFGTGAVREDPFVRFAVSGAGKIARTPEVLMTRVPTLYAGTFDIARRTGRLAVGTGDASTDIWSFDYAGATSRARRETHGTSWYGRPDLSTDGKRMYYYRGDALGDNIYQLDRATGAEEALTAERTPGANDVRLSSDDHRLTYARQAATEVRVQHMELPSRRVTVGPAMEGSLVIPMGARGFLLYLSLSGTWQVLDSLAGAPKTLTIANVQPIVSAAASPDGRTIAVVGVEGVQRGTTAPSKLVVGIAPGAGGTARIVATLPIDDVLPAVTWDSEGELQIVRWRNEDEHPSVWRLSVADGALTRVADLAAPCEPASVVVRPRAHAAVCVVRDYRTDIWLFDIAGVTQKR